MGLMIPILQFKLDAVQVEVVYRAKHLRNPVVVFLCVYFLFYFYCMAFGILLPHSGTESEATTGKAMSPNPGATREFPCGEAVIIFINCTVNLLFLFIL